MSTKERILDEAERLIGKRGLDDLRLRDIADAIGIRVPSIYGHFESRDAVRYGVIERYVEGVSAQFPYDTEDSPGEALRAGIRGYMRFLAARPAFVRLELRDMERPGGWHEINCAYGAAPEDFESGAIAPMYARVAAMLAHGHQCGELRRVDPVSFWRAFAGISLVSLTWPDESALGADASSPALQRLIDWVEDAMWRILRAD